MTAADGPPLRIDVARQTAPDDPGLSRTIALLRDEADCFIFLSGGASKMVENRRDALLQMFGALATLAASGLRFAVGDGGTQAGIMQAAGEARRACAGAFPLIGVVPAREVPPRGDTPIDPNHSIIVAVDDPLLAETASGWGTEVVTMNEVFDRLAAGRRSVTIVANGGAIALAEVAANVESGRTMLLVAGSGRAADALVSLLDDTPAEDPEVIDLSARADAAGLMRRPDLFRVVALESGADGLSAALKDVLTR